MDDEKSVCAAWKIEEPDEAIYNLSDEKGLWQPRSEDILSLLDKLEQAKGGPLPVKWTCPGRRLPEKQAKLDNGASENADKEGDGEKEEELRAPEASTFDFDEFQTEVGTKFRPTPGSHTPRAAKKVAKMEDIMNSLRKQHLQKTAEKEAKRKSGLGTPFGRARQLNFKQGDSRPRVPPTMPLSSETAETPRAQLVEPVNSQYESPMPEEEDDTFKSGVAKSLFLDTVSISTASDLTLDSKSTLLPPEISELSNAALNPADECLTVSTSSTPPPDLKPVVTNLNDLLDPDALTVIAKSPPGFDTSHPEVPRTVLNLEQVSALNDISMTDIASSDVDDKPIEPSSTLTAPEDVVTTCVMVATHLESSAANITTPDLPLASKTVPEVMDVSQEEAADVNDEKEAYKVDEPS